MTDNASYMVDTTTPTITSLLANSATGTITLTYSSPLDSSNAPTLTMNSFTVIQGGASKAVNDVSVSGAVVTLKVAAFTAGSITVAYADPTSGDDLKAIQDLAGNDVASFSSGVVADGYVRGATVYIDTDNNGVGDVLLGTTDASGNFFIPAGAPTGAIIATGGVNIDTGVVNTVALKAPAGSSTINPLTTLVQAVVQASGGTSTAADAAATVASSLGLTLSSGQSLLSYDPIAAASSTDSTVAANAVKAQKAAAQVATIVALAESASPNAGASVMTNLAAVVTTKGAGSSDINLADSTTITNMLGAALDDASASVKAAAQSAIADASTAIGEAKSLGAIAGAQAQALDKTAPSAPTVSVEKSTTNQTTPTVKVSLNTTATDGSAVSANDVLTLKDNNVQIGSSVTVTAADIAAGYKELTVATALTEGTHTLSVVVTDQAGNASAALASASTSLIVDLTPPAAPTMGAVAADNVISSAEQTSAISGTAEADALVSLSIGGNVRTATASAGGAWSYTLTAADLTAMGQGPETLSATATDVAGNVSIAATRVITVDTVAPTTTAAVTGANDNVSPELGNVATGGTSNDNTLGLSGTVSAALAAGDVVAVYDGATRLGVAQVIGTDWTFATAGLSNAAHSFKAQVEDAAGNAGVQGTAYTVTVNAAVPTATVSVSADAVTKDTTPDLSGKVTGALATGDEVRVYDGNTPLGKAVVSAGNWTFTPTSALSEGAHSFTAVVQNAGGNQGAFSAAAATTIDTTAPSVPVINPVATDNIVNLAEVGSTISGTNEVGATVALSIGGISRNATVSGSTWTYTLLGADITAMGQGDETLSATQTDVAGNISAPGTLAIKVDTLAPTVTGVNVSAGDDINASEFAAGATITGTADAGGRVDITFADATTVRSVTVGSNGTWNYLLTKADIGAMGQGSETLTMKATDAAGNKGVAASKTITIDTVAPTMSSFALTTASDSGIKNDGKSNVAVPTVQLTAELGSTLYIDLGNGAGYQAAGTGTGASQTLTAGSAYTVDKSYTIKVKAEDAALNFTERSGSYTYDSTVATPALALASDTSVGQKITSSGIVNVTGLEIGAKWEYSLDAGSSWANGSGSSVALTGDASKSITVRQTDEAGNLSATSSALAFTLDTKVATPTLALTSDTGSSGTDKITQSGVVNVSGLESGGTWRYSTDAGSTWAAGSGSSLTLTGDGSKSVTVQQTDVAGNVSTTSSALAFTVDTTIAKPTVGLADDTGSSKSDNISSSALITQSTAAADVTRTYTVDGTPAAASYTAPTTNAVHTVVVTDTDTAGNVSNSETLTFTLDKAAPTIATAGLSPADNGLSLGLSANLLVTMKEAVAKGTGDLSLYKTGDVLVETIAVGSPQVTLSEDGTIVTINPTADLVKDENYYVKAAAGTFTDIAGNAWAGISTATDWNFKGAGATVTIDKVAVDNTVNLVESGADITVTGTLGAESVVLAAYTTANMAAVLQPATGAAIPLSSLDYAPSTGNWSAVIARSSLIGTADYTLKVSFVGTSGAAKDINGDALQVVHVDTEAAPPTLGLAKDSGPNGSDLVTNSAALKPTGETGSTFQYSADGINDWSASAPTATPGSNTVYARQTDTAGNVSAASTALTFTLDTSAPATPTLALASNTGLTTDTITKVGGFNVTGLESGATWEYSTDGTSWTAGTGTSASLTGDGAKSVTVRQTDLAGNVSESSSALAFTLDTAAAAPTLALASDTGLSDTDKITRDGTVKVTGLESGATWEYSLDAGTSWTDGTGTSASLTGDGAKSVTVRQTDVAGNLSDASSALAFTLDTVAPSKAAITSMTTRTVATTNRLSGDSTPEITVTAETGAQIVLGQSVNGTATLLDPSGYSVVETATKGTYTVSVTRALADGGYGLGVRDAAGNMNTSFASDGSDLATFGIDTVAPTVAWDTGDAQSNGAVAVTFTFSEKVYTFELADISVANGTKSAFSANADGKTFSALLTPTASNTPLVFSFEVAAGAAIDAALNPSVASTKFSASALIGTDGNNVLTVNEDMNWILLGGGNDTIKLSSATGSTEAAADRVLGFGAGDKIDLSAILGGASNAIGYKELYDAPFFSIDSGSLTNAGKTVKFSLVLDSESYLGERIEGLSVNLGYDYANVNLMVVKSAVVKNSDGTNFLTDAGDATTTVATWAPILAGKATGVIQLPQNFIDFDAYALSQTETHLTNSGKAFDVTLTLKTAVTSFDISFDSDFGSVNGVGIPGQTVPVAGQATSISASGASGVVRDNKLQVVSDTGTLGTVGDNQLHMLTTYYASTGLTRLQVQYDTDSVYGANHTSASSIIAMDFLGDLTSVLTPASLIFI